MPLRLYFIIIAFLGCVSVSKGQNIQYDIELTKSDSLFYAKVKMTIPEAVQWPNDTFWIHWPLISYTQKNSVLNNKLIKAGQTDYYFRRESDKAQIKKCEIVVDGLSRELTSIELENEFIAIPTPKNREISFSYDFILPKWLYSFGQYKDKIISFEYFYPKVVYFDGQWRKQPFSVHQKGLHYKQDVTLSTPYQKEYKVIANGKISTHPEYFTVEAKNVSNLFISFVKKDFATINHSLKSGTKTVKYLIAQEPLTKLTDEITKDSIQAIFNTISDLLGPYPYEYLIINYLSIGDEISENNGILYFLDEEYDFTYVLLQTWLDGQFKGDIQVDNWMIPGLCRYYYNKFIPEKLKKAYDAKRFKSNFESQYYNTSLQSKNIGVVQCHLKNYYLSVAFFEYIEEVLGENTLKNALTSLKNNALELNVINLTNELRKLTHKPLDFINNYLNSETPMSFKIKDVDVDVANKGIEVTLYNETDVNLPIPLTIALRSDTIKTVIVEPFEGEKTIKVADIEYVDLKYIVIDKNHILPDVKRGDNFWISDKNIFDSEFYQKIPNYNDSYIFMMPTVTYNDNNRFMVGLFYSNYGERHYKKTGFTLHPSFSFRKKRTTGEAHIYHDFYIPNDLVDRIRLSTGVKSYFFNYNEEWAYAQQYIRIDPEIHFRFKKALRKGIDRAVSVKSYFIQEDYPLFPDGKFSGLEQQNSLIFRAKYHNTHVSTLSSSHHEIALEQQSYNEQSYLKLTATWMQNWMYKDSRYINLRIFGSGFLANTQRQSMSYQNNGFTRGSIALIHHGFNDYTYDEYFFSRQNQNQAQRHQVSRYSGGGFKTAVGSAYSIGMSNNFALAANGSMDLPFGPKMLPIQLYFDMGVFSTYSGDEFVNNLMYNGGFALNLMNLIDIHVPIIYSENLGNIHKEVHKNFFNRISFSFNLDNISTKNLLFKNFRQW